MRRVFAAVDIGASGGRVMAGVVEDGAVALHAVHRFDNGVVRRDGHLRWPVRELFEGVLAGLAELARRFPDVESIGVDTWAVDYALLDASGELLDDPIAYRDPRTALAIDAVHGAVPAAELYAITGVQHLPFNTVYQLVADRLSGRLRAATHVALIPDLLVYWLTGELRAERTNASTTALVDAQTGNWSDALLDALRLDRGLLPPLDEPGAERGRVLRPLAARVGLDPAVVVTTVASHDTASAVAAVPALDRRFAYVASGTWSLVGLELDRPIITARSREANFTNEGGVDGRIRFLRNTGGLWLLQESMRSWASAGREVSLAEVLADAAQLPAGGPVIDVDDERFIPPGDMPARIAAAVASGASGSPMTPGEVTRCILDSLAAAYATTVDAACDLAGVPADAVHVVGGGSQNALLCQLAADRTRRAVVAGPVEATALGNVVVQARARGALPESLDEIRTGLAGTVETVRYEPGADGERS